MIETDMETTQGQNMDVVFWMTKH